MDQTNADLSYSITADSSDLRKEFADLSRIGEQFGRSLTRAFSGLILQGKSFGDVLRSLGQSLARMAFNAAFKPLEGFIGSIFKNIFAGGFAFANGGVIQQGLPVPFARGGIVASPTTFPLAGGRMGLMGERGPEAIMPLARGPDGRLGVRAEASATVAISFTVNAADAESFLRSEAQITAMLARAVARGQRNL